MEVKKNPNVDIHKDKMVYTTLGLFFMCSIAFAMFSFKQFEKPKAKIVIQKVNDDAQQMENTVHEKLPPPPPPPPTLQVVEDDVEVEDNSDAFIEPDPDDAIIAPPPIVVAPPAEKVVEPEIYEKVEVEPKFPGGEAGLHRFLQENLEYPFEAEREYIEGTIIVYFVVDEHGKVSQVTTEKKFGFCLEEEAMRVVKLMPNWSPGKQRNKNVKVRYKIPITFILPE
jgi:protein TonB